MFESKRNLECTKKNTMYQRGDLLFLLISGMIETRNRGNRSHFF